MSSGSDAAEFDLIARYFAALGAARRDVELAVGDDAALLAPQLHGIQVTCATAALPEDAAEAARVAAGLSRQALDALAEASATPAWATLALTLERARPEWLDSVSRALHDVMCDRGVQVVGGDTTRGPCTLTVHVLGIAAGQTPDRTT